MNGSHVSSLSARTRKIVSLGMLAALATLVMFLFHLVPLPIVGLDFLKYDPKDVVIVITGFIYGPLAAAAVSVVVSLIEMVTVSSTWLIGFVMNVLSTCAFACPAALIYKRRQNLSGAVIGLVTGVLSMTGVMLLWNYYLTPLYMGLPREAVAAMLLPTFLPFNLIKGGLNAAVTLLLYKPLVSALRRTGLLAAHRPGAAQPATKQENGAPAGGFRPSAGVIITALLVLASCVLFILAIQGVI